VDHGCVRQDAESDRSDGESTQFFKNFRFKTSFFEFLAAS
jgi:hypothetical protein